MIRPRLRVQNHPRRILLRGKGIAALQHCGLQPKCGRCSAQKPEQGANDVSHCALLRAALPGRRCGGSCIICGLAACQISWSMDTETWQRPVGHIAATGFEPRTAEFELQDSIVVKYHQWSRTRVGATSMISD